MIDFKAEEQKYQQILHIKEVLAGFRAYDVIRQLQIDIMHHFNIFSPVVVDLTLDENQNVIVASPFLGSFSRPYEEIAHLVTGILYDNQIKAEFTKKIPFRGVTFGITSYRLAQIPEEELTLLELLGKVEIETTPAQPSQITKTIFCPTSLDVPF